MHHLDAQAEHLFCPLFPPSLVAGIYPQVRKARKAIAYTLQQQFNPILIGNLGAVHLSLQHQPFRIHQQVSLSASDLFATVVASLLPAYSGRLGRLRIDYPSAGMRVSP
jgi:hypothetical protein